MHESIRDSKVPSGGSDRSFGLVMAGVCMVLACWPLIRGGAIRTPFLGFAALLVIIALFAPGFLRLANHVWMRFSHLVSCVMNPVVMAVIFFGVVTPIALLMRLGGKCSLRLAPDPRATSYWTTRDPADSVPDGRIF